MIRELFIIIYFLGIAIIAYGIIKRYIWATPDKLIFKITVCVLWFIPATAYVIHLAKRYLK
jgi:hypothetical protein